MFLKAYDNDLVRATESLMLENGMLRFLTPPVGPEDSTSPSVFVMSDSEQSPSDARLSAFSPVSSPIPYSRPVLPPTLPSHMIPPFTPATFSTRSMIKPVLNHISMPFHPYMRPHAGGGG